MRRRGRHDPGGIAVTRVARVAAVTEREFRTVLRTRALWLLSLGFFAVVVGLVWTGGAAAYASAVLDLLTPVEVLVPTLAFAFAYRSILEDRRRGELETIRTYPVSRGEFVVGVYLGRAAALLTVVVVTLGTAGVVVGTGVGVRSSVIASHAGADSPLLFVQFLVLVAVLALVALAVAVAVSAVAGSVRGALALAVALALAFVAGFDLGIVAALTRGYLTGGGLEFVLAVSPNSAFRGLVLTTALEGATTDAGVRAATPAASVLGLFLWWVAGVGLATWRVWRPGR